MPTPLATCVASLNQAAEAVWPAMAQTLADHPAEAMHGFTVEVVPTIGSTPPQTPKA